MTPHPRSLEGRIRYLADRGDMVGRRPHVFWKTFLARTHILNAMDFRPIADVGQPYCARNNVCVVRIPSLGQWRAPIAFSRRTA